MTPLAGCILGILAGLLVWPPPRAAPAAIPPWVAVLVVQTWHLAAGYGIDSSSTVHEPGYWVAQLLSLVLTVVIAASVSVWRSRRVSDAGGNTMTVAWTGTLSAVAALVSFALALPIIIYTSSGHGQGGGGPPIFGIAGYLACAVVIVVLGIANLIAGKRAPELPAGLAPGEAP